MSFMEIIPLSTNFNISGEDKLCPVEVEEYTFWLLAPVKKTG